ncbi:MAG: cation:proton antiporter [Acidobacteriota bacterium]
MIFFAFLILPAGMYLFRSPLLAALSLPEQSTSLAFGFLLLFAFLGGKIIHRLKLPRITGFLLAGMICGPYILKLLKTSDVTDFQLFDGLALSLIALTAGGEMKIGEIRKRMRTISSLVLMQSVFIILGFLAIGFVLKPFIPFVSQMTAAQNTAVWLLLGTLATATSPSTTIAVINETGADGPMSDLVLTTAVFKDFFIIIFFAFALSFSRSLVGPGTSFDLGFLLRILRDIGGSLLIGLAVGLSIILYLRFIRRDITLFILGIAFFTYQISHHHGFHPLLICLLAGFLVENYSPHGDRLIQAIEKSSLPVYVIFFAISGASLDLNALREGWPLALLLVVWRGVLKFAGTYAGARINRENQDVRRFAWTGFISQAGVALGMAIMIERTFPEWGGMFKTIVLAVIAINQVIGPIFLQKMIYRAGEA